jgi:hypothetical protein
MIRGVFAPEIARRGGGETTGEGRHGRLRIELQPGPTMAAPGTLSAGALQAEGIIQDSFIIMANGLGNGS